MVSIKKIFSKLGNTLNNGNQSHSGRPMTGDEVELYNYKERERLLGVKRELSEYRKKNALLNGISWDKELGNESIDITHAKSAFNVKQKKHKQTSILNQKNVMMGNKPILKQGRCF